MTEAVFKDNVVIITGGSSGIGRVPYLKKTRGRLVAVSVPVREADLMSAEECALIIVKAIARRKPEEVMK